MRCCLLYFQLHVSLDLGKTWDYVANFVNSRFYWAIPGVDKNDTVIHIEKQDPASGDQFNYFSRAQQTNHLFLVSTSVLLVHINMIKSPNLWNMLACVKGGGGFHVKVGKWSNVYVTVTVQWYMYYKLPKAHLDGKIKRKNKTENKTPITSYKCNIKYILLKIFILLL